MKMRKFLIGLAVALCLCVGVSAAVGAFKYTDARAEYTDNDNFVKFTVDKNAEGTWAPLVYNYALSGTYTVEFDMKLTSYGLKAGFGLAVPESGGYNTIAGGESAMILCEGNVLEMAWNNAAKAASRNGKEPIQNYDEGYYNNKMLNKVRVKMQVEDGDLTLYAKSLEKEKPSDWTGEHTTEYVQIADTYTGVVASNAYFAFYIHEPAAAEGQPIPFASLYGVRATDADGKTLYEDDFSKNYVEATDRYYKTERFNKALADGAIAMPAVPVVADEGKMVVRKGDTATAAFADGMFYVNKPVSGASDIIMDMKLGLSDGDAEVFMGLYSNTDDTNFYSNPYVKMNQARIAHKDETVLDTNGEYNEAWYNQKYFNKIRLRIRVESDGTAKLYVTSLADDSVNMFLSGGSEEERAALKQSLRTEKLAATAQEVFAPSMASPYYFGFSIRNATVGDIEFYNVRIEQDGTKVFEDAFANLNTSDWVISQQVKNALSGEYVDIYVTEEVKQEIEVYLSGDKRKAYAGDEIDLTPEVSGAADDAAVSVTVKNGGGDTLQPKEGNVYAFAVQGDYSVIYTVTQNDEVVYTNEDKPTVVTVKNKSTQKSANVNFNDGYCDGAAWELSASGAGIVNNRLILSGGKFTTKGYSEIGYMTLDVVGIGETTSEFSLVFGDAYAFVFGNGNTVTFTAEGEEDLSFDIGKNVIAELHGGKQVTLRLSVKSDNAELFVKISDESAEVLETAAAKAEKLRFVGKIGIAASGENKIAVDDVSFVNMTSVADDNTNTTVPEDKPNPPDPEKPTPSNPKKKGCGCGSAAQSAGTVCGAGSVLAVCFAVCLIGKKKKENR